MKKLIWNDVMYREFLRLSILSDFERDVFDMSVKKKYPVYRIAMELNCSESTINRTLKSLCSTYDTVQFISPILPPRT